jgi:hypothetical protein
MGMHLGRECGKRSQVVIDRRMSQPLRLQGFLPRLDIAAKARREAIVPVGIHKERLKTPHMQGNFLGDCF